MKIFSNSARRFKVGFGYNQQNAFYVRPSSGEYGREDGRDYDNAFDGEAGINWSVLQNQTLIAIGFADNSITKLEPTTTIYYTNGIGSMVVNQSFFIR